MIMLKQQFTLYLENRPGELARITKKLALEKVNLDGISVANSPDVALVQLVVSNAAATRRVLKSDGVAFTEQKVVLVPLENKPGALAEVVTHLSKAKININYVYATACEGKNGGKSYAVISTPALKKVEDVWKKVAG
jgi:hypothetical protein